MLKFFHRHRPFFLSQSNFILRVAPLKKRHQRANQRYFPPPGYGIPIGKKAQFIESKEIGKVAQYGFYLTLGRLAKDYFLISFALALCVFLPLIKVDLTWIESIKGVEVVKSVEIWGILYIAVIALYLLIVGSFYRWLYYYHIPPVLSDIWPLWPEPSYRLLQSVPHKVQLARADKLTHLPSLYWNPKKTCSLFRQPQEYAKKTPTLQSVLLDFAVFELFFFSRSRKNKKHQCKGNVKADKKSIDMMYKNEVDWLYWLSPIFINYFMLLIVLLLTWLMFPSLGSECTSIDLNGVQECIDKVGFRFFNQENLQIQLFVEPKQALSLSIMVWAGIAYWFMKVRLLSKLERLKERVEQGYFVRHLNLVPPQILAHMKGIPKAKHIGIYISDLYRLLSFVMLFAVVSYIGIIDGSF